MTIRSIRIKQFRNHTDSSFTFEQPRLLITGPNAKGKTTILEALHLGLVGVGFRSKDDSLIQYDKDWARVDLETSSGLRTFKLQARDGFIHKQLEKDGVSLRRGDLFRRGMAVVLFEPEELRMFIGGPDLRRAWLDQLLATLDPTYAVVLHNYQRALRQRNKLLKQPGAQEDQYFVWELKLSEYGESIVNARNEIISAINQNLSEHFRSISGGSEELVITYNAPDGSYAAWLANNLRLRREHDQRVGYTTAGPHRDDFEIIRDGQPLSSTGSRGELRSVALALKLFEISVIKERLGITPALLLDDVLGELDPTRQLALLSVTTDCQVFITATELLPAIHEALGTDTQRITL